MIFVDSSVWIDYFNGTDGAAASRLDALLGREPLVVGDIVLTEVLQGFRSESGYRKAARLMGAFETVTVLGPQRARLAANHHRQLRRLGITVRKTIDTLIATCCIDQEFWLLHADRDFEPFVRHCGLRTLS
ncbi:MAG: PIN domain nuclease [Pseudomonadota bacterium]